jgi:tetratricopeptide (TPR) repeat protein
LKKNLKKQIKEDEFVSWVEHTQEFVRKRSDEVKIALVAITILAVGAGALAYFRSQRNKEASEALSVALEKFRAPVGSEGPGPARFATSTEKYRQVLGEFEGIERRFASSDLAPRARYYGALCKIELGQLDDAEATLRAMAASQRGDRLEPALAELTLADVERRKGKIDQAITAYKQIADDLSSQLPRDHALMSLGATYEEADRLELAQGTYKRLLREFPDSSYAPDARRRVEYLEAHG